VKQLHAQQRTGIEAHGAYFTEVNQIFISGELAVLPYFGVRQQQRD
jgi:hypothetical protein